MKNLLILLFIAFSFLVIPSDAFAQAATMSVSPATGAANKGCLFPVSININTAGAESDGSDAILIYDPTRFQAQIQDIIVGSIFPDYPVHDIDSASGRISVSGISSASTPFSGSGTLATINFMVLDTAPTGATQLTFDFDPQDKGKTSDSNIVQRVTIVDLLSSVGNGSYTIGTGACPTGIGGTDGIRGTPIISTPSATTIPVKPLPDAGTPELTYTLAIVGGVLTVLGILGLALL